MDCDENDFQSQSQNQQLADEGSIKFSPVLQPFGLSKFDFDDNLQGHLRFDSLVESEVFLGIGNNIDRQWIEDYSRGNSAIEFTTCASESCSISRHNNVWSEATSSESVEMLLKSVGLEEAMPRQPSIQPSNSSEPCSTITQMEPNLTDNTGIISDKADASPGESLSPLTEISPSSTTEKAVKEHQPFAEVVLQTWNGTSPEGNLIKEDLIIQSENFGSPTTLNLEAHRKDVVAHGESDSQHLSDLEIQELNASASMEIVTIDYDRTENMVVLGQENTVDNVFHAESQNDAKGAGPLTITEEACRNNEYFEESTAGNVQFTSDTAVSDHLTEAYMEEGNDMRINVVLESPDIPSKASSDMQSVDELAEGASAPTTAQATPVENLVLDEDAGVGGLSEGREDRSPSVSRLTEDVVKCDPDVGVGSTVTEVPSGFEHPMDSSKQKSPLATETSTDNTDALDQDPSPSAVAVMPKEEVQRNDAFGDPVGQVTREQVATEKSTLPVGPAEERLGPLEFKQGLASLAGRDELGGFTNSEVPEKSGEAALESSARDNEANAKMDTSSNQLSFSVLPSELPSHHSAPEGDREPCLTCPDVADGAARESHRVSDLIEAATHSPQSVDTGKEFIDKSGSTAGKGDDIFPTLEKADEVSVEGSSSMTPGNICESPALPSIDLSNSGKANISSPIVISSVEVSEKEISQEQTEKSINHKLLPSDGKDMFDMQNAEETEISKDDKSFTFDVTSLDKRGVTKNWKTFSSVSDLKATQFAEGSTIPALLQVENQGLVLNNVETPQNPVKKTPRGRKKDSSEHKPRQASRKGAAKESGKKSSSVKDSAASKQIETVDKLSPHSVTPPGAHQPFPSGELQHHGQIDFTAAKSFGVLTAATSGLSDLNSSAFGNMVFCQPFTDLQQVQLRAQIFVYGSLISKLVPEEVHMISAFGGPDGGRSMWENAWRVCRERVLGQASVSAILETPVKSRAGEVIFDQVTNHGTRQAAVSSSPAVRSNSKGTVSPAINLVQPLSSPVWSISTQSFDASQFGTLPKGAVPPTFSTFHPNQSPPVANFFGPSSSWMSQTPFRSPWSASTQTSMQESGARVPLLSVTESVKLAPVLELPVSVPSGTASLPSVPAGLLPSASPAVDPKKAAILPGHPSESKSRKRKKVSASADPGLISSNQSQIQLNPIPAPIGPHSAIYPSIGPHSAIFAPARTAGFLSETRMDKHVLKSPSYSFGDSGLQEFDKSKSALSEDSIVKVREAMKQAEDAAALASTAVNHSRAIWDQLNKYKNSGNVATAEVKLASAAAAISAAASVAKAAAAAASVASKAALQAKLMADEAMNPSRSNGHSSHGDYSSIVGGKDVSSSILMGDSTTNFSNSAISEAREAVRKKIEAASAASLQAENLDALVKAAELAAEAIAKAGKVVAMGDPLPLTVLAEAGPDGFWKLASLKDSSELYVAKVGVAAATITDSGQQMAELKHNKGTLVRSMNETLGESSSQGKKGSKVSETGNSEGNFLAELQYRPDNATHNNVYGAVEMSQQNNIKVGAQVEVFKSGEEFKSAWFSAKVLSLKDGKALVCYSEIPSNEGSGKLEEWVDLECVVDEPPKLRLAHPMTVMKFEGTRKRRRAAMGVFTCSVGDKVDAWIKDCWRGGVVTDKDKKDGTTVTVHFPAYGDNSVVRAWHLRPSLIWKNGEWVEWTSTVGTMNLEGDTPQEKRAKLGTPGLAPREKDKESKDTQHLVEKEKPPQEESLKLTSEEKVFNVGKKAADGKKDPVRTRTGLRKESSRVVIGVPKPEKKRKFMEVSKHLVGNQTKKTGELKDSAKLASYLIPQGGGPHGWKPFSRSDTKDKGVADSKTKVLRSGRSQNTSGRALPPKRNLAAVNSCDGPPRDIPDHDAFKRHNTSEFKPLSESEDAASEGHGDPVTSSDTGSFKSSMATVRAARVTKGRVPSGKVAKDEENKASSSDPSKSAADGAEPRRSNRRIQPTSRLLEGLQSSIVITKFPSALHDRGHKVASKGAAKGKSNG